MVLRCYHGNDNRGSEEQVYDYTGSSCAVSPVPLQVTCYDWDSDGSHDLIGHFTTSLGEITDAYHNQKKVCATNWSW